MMNFIKDGLALIALSAATLVATGYADAIGAFLRAIH